MYFEAQFYLKVRLYSKLNVYLVFLFNFLFLNVSLLTLFYKTSLEAFNSSNYMSWLIFRFIKIVGKCRKFKDRKLSYFEKWTWD